MHFNSTPFELISCTDWGNLLLSAAGEGTIIAADSDLKISTYRPFETNPVKQERLSLAKIYTLSIQKLMQSKVNETVIAANALAMEQLLSKKNLETKNLSHAACSYTVATAKTVKWAASFVPYLGSHLDYVRYVPYANSAVQYVSDLEKWMLAEKQQLEKMKNFYKDFLLASEKTKEVVAKIHQIAESVQKNIPDDPVQGILGVIKTEVGKTSKEDPDMIEIFKKDFNRNYCFTIIDSTLPTKTHIGLPIEEVDSKLKEVARIEAKYSENAPNDPEKYLKFLNEFETKQREKFIIEQIDALRSVLKTHPSDRKWLPIIQASCCQGILLDPSMVKIQTGMLTEIDDDYKWRDALGYKHKFYMDYDSRFFVDIQRNKESKEIEKVTIRLNTPLTIFALTETGSETIKTKVDSSVSYSLVFDLFFENDELKVKIIERHFF